MAKQLPKRDLENVGLCVTGACVALVTLVVAALIFMVAQKGLSAFLKDGVSVVEFFTGTKWDLANTAKNGLPYTGALPLIVTSFAVMVLSALIALPIAIGSAIFAVEIKPKFGSKIFQPLIELLTGIPSVVFGLIGFHVVVGLMKSVFHVSTGLGILPGAIVLAVMILPSIISVSETALRAVPREYEEASLALGATHERSVFFAQLPAATSGVMSGVILGVGRAIGETMAVIMIAGNQPIMPRGLLEGLRTMTANVVLEMGYASGLHRRAGQDDAVDLLVPEGSHSGGHGQIGLAGTRGADADGDGILHDGLHVVLLTYGLGLDGFSLGGDAHHILRHLRHLGVVALVDQRNQVTHPLLVDGLALGGQRQQPLQRAHGLIRHFFVPGDPEVCPPVHHPDVQGILNSFDIFVKRAKHRDQVFHPLGVDDSFNHFSHLYLQSVLCGPGRSFPRRHTSLPKGTYPPTA